jgi:hypothetical protein
MTIDNAGGLSSYRDVREKADGEAGADGNPVDRRNDGLVAIDDIVDKVFGLFPGCHPDSRVVNDVFEQFEVAAGRKRFACTRHDYGVDVRIVVDVAPNIRKLGVRFGIDRIIGLLTIKRQSKDPL